MNTIIWGLLLLLLLAIVYYRKGGKFTAKLPLNGLSAHYRLIGYGVVAVIVIYLMVHFQPWHWFGDIPSSGSLIWWGLVALLAGLLFSGSLPKEWKGWRKLPTLLGLMLIIAGVYTSGMGIATSRWFETNIEQCLGDENCPEENEAAKTLTASPKVLAKGVLKAKFDHPTATIHISRGQKIFWSSNAIQKIEDHGRTVNFDLDADKFIALAKVNGQWYEYDQLSCWEKREIRAVRWIARYPGPPIGISYQIYKSVEDSSRC